MTFPDILAGRGVLVIGIAEHPVEFLRPPGGALAEIHLPDRRARAADRQVQTLLAGTQRVAASRRFVTSSSQTSMAGSPRSESLPHSSAPRGNPALRCQAQLAASQPLAAGQHRPHLDAIVRIGQKMVERRPGARHGIGPTICAKRALPYRMLRSGPTMVTPIGHCSRIAVTDSASPATCRRSIRPDMSKAPPVPRYRSAVPDHDSGPKFRTYYIISPGTAEKPHRSVFGN